MQRHLPAQGTPGCFIPQDRQDRTGRAGCLQLHQPATSGASRARKERVGAGWRQGRAGRVVSMCVQGTNTEDRGVVDTVLHGLHDFHQRFPVHCSPARQHDSFPRQRPHTAISSPQPDIGGCGCGCG
eukprot:TRINITY_DN1963_c0_g1_i12.p2 TRINITY_DN1963_c0_g1~~TRINITY_DN1963_c0_g1_i12.p2  ORF type:complete len:127 (-),score=12.43 TRINITY_DN1963_c0_g1_i12:52-432(-)